ASTPPGTYPLTIAVTTAPPGTTCSNPATPACLVHTVAGTLVVSPPGAPPPAPPPPSTLPTIIAVATSSGPVDTPVTITGTNFTAASWVMFGIGRSVPFTVVSPTVIHAVVSLPPCCATAGDVSDIAVVTPTGAATSGGFGPSGQVLPNSFT